MTDKVKLVNLTADADEQCDRGVEALRCAKRLPTIWWSLPYAHDQPCVSLFPATAWRELMRGLRGELG